MARKGEYLAKKFAENDKNGPKGWDAIFRNISARSIKRAKSLNLSCKVAYAIDNVEKNRYRDISPYDNCRIELGPDKGYINASPVTVTETGQQYILCQGPLEETSADFWQMIWEQEVPTIVMLNKLIERGTLKCAPYYPDKENNKIQFDPYTITCDSETEGEDHTVRRLTLSKEGTEESKKVVHMQYTDWPDFGVPQTPEHLLHFMRKYWEDHGRDSTAPSVVHCSAGVGRSGTFVVVDSIIRMVEAGNEKVDIEEFIVNLRDSRMGLIQTWQQLRFSWLAIISYFDEARGGPIEGLAEGAAAGDKPGSLKRDASPGSGASNEALAKRQEGAGGRGDRGRGRDSLARPDESWKARLGAWYDGLANTLANLLN